MTTGVHDLDARRPHQAGLSICGLCGHTWAVVVPAFDGVERAWAGAECGGCGKMAAVIVPLWVADVGPDVFNPLIRSGVTPLISRAENGDAPSDRSG